MQRFQFPVSLSEVPTLFRRGIATVSFALITVPALCGELVYIPVNPAFGGSPLNGSVLLNAAQAQNKTKDPDAPAPLSSSSRSSLQQFNEILERSILSRLATTATSSIIGPDGQLIPGSVETSNFLISITDLLNGTLQVTTTDKVTGASTSFQVGQIN